MVQTGDTCPRGNMDCVQGGAGAGEAHNMQTKQVIHVPRSQQGDNPRGLQMTHVPQRQQMTLVP